MERCSKLLPEPVLHRRVPKRLEADLSCALVMAEAVVFSGQTPPTPPPKTHRLTTCFVVIGNSENAVSTPLDDIIPRRTHAKIGNCALSDFRRACLQFVELLFDS